MLNKLALTAAAAAAILGLSTEAHAAPTWHLSPVIANTNGACLTNGIYTQVGYYGEPTPRVGHTQDAALVVVVAADAGCGPITAVPDFVLPFEIEQDTSVDVECTLVSADGNTRKAITDPQFCNTDPIENTLGLGNVHGWWKLQPGETLEVYLPVTWKSPVTTTQFHVEVRNNKLTTLYPTIQLGIAPAPTFDSFTVAQNGSSATASVVLRNGETASAVIEYGTTTNYAYATPAQTTFVSASQQLSFSLTNLQPGTTYHWRVRYLVPYLGAYWSADQTFTTPMAEIVIPNPNPPPIVYPCRFIRCR